ncbi:hypothetical protein diail_2816 [Diaporthe ilicicola]|nr:hypothetical protein diail_2816 [Diaporthe ilicicola]
MTDNNTQEDDAKRLEEMLEQGAKGIEKAITKSNAIAERLAKEAQKPSAADEAEVTRKEGPPTPQRKGHTYGGNTQNNSHPLPDMLKPIICDRRPYRYDRSEERDRLPTRRFENEDESANALFGHKKEYLEGLKKREPDDDGF